MAVEGFVTDYIVWRLEKDNLEWPQSSDVPDGADTEHTGMRRVCEIFEQKREAELQVLDNDLGSDDLHFAKYAEVVKEFCANDSDLGNEMTYGRLVGLIAFAGVLCVRKAREKRNRDIGLIALYTSKMIDAGIRMTWIESGRSWAGFMSMTQQVIVRHSSSKGPRPGPPPPTSGATPAPASPAPRNRRSSLLFVAGVGVAAVGALVAHRVFIRSH